MPTKQPILYSLLACLSLLGAYSVLVVDFIYSYNRLYTAASAFGALTLVSLAGLFWWGRKREYPYFVYNAVRLGVLTGFIWVVEIALNNLLAPPIQQRDLMDNLYWVLISIIILGYSGIAAYRSRRIQIGILTGIVSGTVSGLLACTAGLILILFGMQFLLHDPANIAEWAQVTSLAPAQSMAAYFAFQTLAGAFLHLFVLGTLMGGLLGLVGGLSGKIIGQTASRK